MQGIALSANPNYKVLGAAYPWIARRLLLDTAPELRETLRSLLYKVTPASHLLGQGQISTISVCPIRVGVIPGPLPHCLMSCAGLKLKPGAWVLHTAAPGWGEGAPSCCCRISLPCAPSRMFKLVLNIIDRRARRACAQAGSCSWCPADVGRPASMAALLKSCPGSRHAGGCAWSGCSALTCTAPCLVQHFWILHLMQNQGAHSERGLWVPLHLGNLVAHSLTGSAVLHRTGASSSRAWSRCSRKLPGPLQGAGSRQTLSPRLQSLRRPQVQCCCPTPLRSSLELVWAYI